MAPKERLEDDDNGDVGVVVVAVVSPLQLSLL
jgi:hypothetical protein